MSKLGRVAPSHFFRVDCGSGCGKLVELWFDNAMPLDVMRVACARAVAGLGWLWAGDRAWCPGASELLREAAAEGHTVFADGPSVGEVRTGIAETLFLRRIEVRP